LLRHERLKLGERVDTLKQLVSAARDAAEAASSTPSGASDQRPNELPSEGNADSWEQIRLAWRSIRDRIELAIENIGHRSVRGKYARIARYSYADVINALRKDREISPTVASRLLQMDAMFNRLKFRPKAVTPSQVSQFKAWLDLVDAFLPRLPDEEPTAPSVAPATEPAKQAA
jgi:hypothetical protein